ncbi:MAG: hypothetical protein QGG50_03550, partial [Methanopyri archaeon]|nr:hypothetical protein [Methanopyri archaeon]
LTPIAPDEEVHRTFPEDEWGPENEFSFYIGESIYKTADIYIGEDSTVYVRRTQGFDRRDNYDPLSRSTVPLTYSARTEPFDIVLRGMGSLVVSCARFNPPSAIQGDGMVVVSESSGAVP